MAVGFEFFMLHKSASNFWDSQQIHNKTFWKYRAYSCCKSTLQILITIYTLLLTNHIKFCFSVGFVGDKAMIHCWASSCTKTATSAGSDDLLLSCLFILSLWLTMFFFQLAVLVAKQVSCWNCITSTEMVLQVPVTDLMQFLSSCYCLTRYLNQCIFSLHYSHNQGYHCVVQFHGESCEYLLLFLLIYSLRSVVPLFIFVICHAT